MRRRIASGVMALHLGLLSVLPAQVPVERSPHEGEGGQASLSLVEQKESASSSEAWLRALIQRAEAFFQRGEAAYRQGDFVRAREEFDRAVDVILEARVNVTAHPQLLAYYRQLIERIHAYQLEAAMQGMELRQQYEPSLLEELAKIELREEDIKAAEQETEEITLDFPVANVGQLIIVHLTDEPPIEPVATRRGRVQAPDDIHQRGLPRTGGPDDGHVLVGVNEEVYAA